MVMLPETAKNAVFMPWRMLIRWAKDAWWWKATQYLEDQL